MQNAEKLLKLSLDINQLAMHKENTVQFNTDVESELQLYNEQKRHFSTHINISINGNVVLG